MASEEPRTQQRQQTITRRHAIAKQAWHEQDGVCRHLLLGPELAPSCVDLLLSCYLSRALWPHKETTTQLCKLPCDKHFLMVMAVEISFQGKA